MTTTVRDEVMAVWDTVQMAKSLMLHGLRIGQSEEAPNNRLTLDSVRSWLMYAAEHPSRGRRTPMDIDAMVGAWLPIIKGLATAHDKDTLDEAEFKIEQHLLPLMAAPVAQLRAFYATLCEALKADPVIPFFVWVTFEHWGEVILKAAPDGAVKALKTQLATEIADLVEADVRPDLKAALVGALQWRPAEALEKIREGVKAGAKPRLVGKESCLFLQVGDATVML
mgnify:CR=1 FL=1